MPGLVKPVVGLVFVPCLVKLVAVLLLYVCVLVIRLIGIVKFGSVLLDASLNSSAIDPEFVFVVLVTGMFNVGEGFIYVMLEVI